MSAQLNIVLAMQVFTRVVEAGTFTKAADSLKMPKATVTKLVQGLENHLRGQTSQPNDAPRDGHGGRLGVLRTGRAAPGRSRRHSVERLQCANEPERHA